MEKKMWKDNNMLLKEVKSSIFTVDVYSELSYIPYSGYGHFGDKKTSRFEASSIKEIFKKLSKNSVFSSNPEDWTDIKKFPSNGNPDFGLQDGYVIGNDAIVDFTYNGKMIPATLDVRDDWKHGAPEYLGNYCCWVRISVGNPEYQSFLSYGEIIDGYNGKLKL